MDEADARALEHVAEQLSAIYGRRSWILAEPVLEAALGRADGLRQLGAKATFALGASAVGPVTGPVETPYAALGVTTRGMMAHLHDAERVLDQVPVEVSARIAAWDPEHEARAIRAVFSEGRPVAGRASFGARPAAWQALDDKTVIDGLWDALGVDRAPSRVVPADRDALDEAHRSLDSGVGTVWALDNRDGWNGAATGVRWVHDATTQRQAADFVTARADRVRVMPFLDGLPCSIHGLVFPDHVAVFRPCEMVVLRDRARGTFHYATAATLWDPPPDGRRAWRAMARRIGAHLRADIGYRGAFTLDGVWTRDGFRPTELNPRMGAALNLISATLPSVDLYLVHLALAEGVRADWNAVAFERAVLAAADHDRRVRCRLLVPGEPEERTAGLVADGESWAFATADDSADLRVRVGPSPGSASLSLQGDGQRLPVGAPIAPRIASAAAFLSEAWGLGLPDLRAASMP